MGKLKKNNLSYLMTPYQFDDFKKGEIEEFTLPAFFAGTIEEGRDFDVCIIHPIGPFKSYHDNIVVFPFSFQYQDKHGKNKIGYIQKSVLYKNKLYTQNKFFKSGKMLNRELLLETQKPLSCIRVSKSILLLSPKEYKKFAEEITPIRKRIKKWAFEPIPDGRGIKPKFQFVKEFVIRNWKALGEPKKISGEIIDDWDGELAGHFPNDANYKPLDAQKVWRIIRDYKK